MDPARLKKWLTAIGTLYLLFPRDLIPDFLGGGLGFVDDLLVIGCLAYFYRGFRRDAASRARAEEEPGARSERSSSGRARTETGGAGGRPRSPYETLGVDPAASDDEIRAAYRARMHEYHPDKVAHLGEELQRLAHHKATEIQQAFETLRSRRT